jgi:hypothetical protein
MSNARPKFEMTDFDSDNEELQFEMSGLSSDDEQEQVQAETTQSGLATYFQPSFRRAAGNFSVIEYIYKQGTTQEATLGLRNAPQTAKAFYDLAVAIDNGTLAHREDSYFFAGLLNPEQHESFLTNILMDAARANYQPARAFLAQLILDPAYVNFAPSITQLLNEQGYYLVSNKGHKAQLDFWAQRPAPRSIAELEKLAHDLETQGSIGDDYFLVNPNGTDALIHTLRSQAKQLRAKGAHWIEEKLVELRNLARAGKLETAQKLTQGLLDTGTEVYTEKAHLNRLVQVTQGMLSLALDSQPTEESEKPTVLKTTGQHKQALKQPQLAGEVTRGLLSANVNALNFNRLNLGTHSNTENQPALTPSQPASAIKIKLG